MTTPAEKDAMALAVLKSAKFDIESGSDGLWRIAASSAELQALVHAAEVGREFLRGEDWRERWPLFTPTRYPYTYAYDLVRAWGAALCSRSDASLYLTELCNERGHDREELCQQLADAYIAEQITLERAVAERKKTVEELLR